MSGRFSLLLTVIVAAALWVAGVVTGLLVPLVLAAVLLVLIVLSAVQALVSRVLLRASVSVGQVRWVQRGDEVTVDVRLHAPLVWGPAHLSVDLPRALGGSRTVHATPHMLLTVPALAHGPQQLGEVYLTYRDVCGFFRVHTRVGTSEGSLMIVPVAPRLTPLTGVDRGGAGATELSLFSRPYVPGDDVRRIHWKSTARSGSLMTRETEAGVGDLVVIATVPALRTTEGGGADDGYELVCDAAASRAAEALRANREVLVCIDSALWGPRTRDELMEGLAYGRVTAAAQPQHRLRDAHVIVVSPAYMRREEAVGIVQETYPVLHNNLEHAQLVPATEEVPA